LNDRRIRSERITLAIEFMKEIDRRRLRGLRAAVA
jgi:hypothetical protein